jgi:hypothetical protein
MATAIISHWGAELEADSEALLEEPIFGLLQRPLADAFAQVEKFDLRVGRVTLNSVTESDELNIVVQIIPELLRPDGQGPSKYCTKIRCCIECHIPWAIDEIHAENGCPYGTVDHVMSS